jgi:hypothetical protein
MRIALAALLLIAGTEAAAAAHCGHGRIFRVSMGVCVGAHSSLARGFVRAHYTMLPRGHHQRIKRDHCDPVTQCGDPISDRVIDNEPPQTMTPRDEPVLLPDPFGRSRLGVAHSRAGTWRLP